VQVRHEARLLGQQPQQVLVQLDRIERGEAQALELGNQS
jgi:hypothetical protein